MDFVQSELSKKDLVFVIMKIINCVTGKQLCDQKYSEIFMNIPHFLLKVNLLTELDRFFDNPL